MNQNTIEVKELKKIFKIPTSEKSFFGQKKENLIALDDLTFSVKKGEVFGILGNNGSGKTTLLKLISEIYLPDSGSVKTFGRIAPLLQIGTGFHNELTADENIVNYGLLLGIKKQEIKKKIKDIIEFAELQKFVNMKIKHYSTGMKTRLAFSVAMQVNPDILLLDEVLSVGDIVFKRKSYQAFLKFKEKGKTIIFTSHNLVSISEICDRVMILDKGKIVDIGEPTEMIQKYKELTNK